jgi:hypothetical protein
MQLQFKNVVSFTRDSCATNGKTLRLMQQNFIYAEDFLCICHTLDNAGDHFDFPKQKEFMMSWLILVCNNPAAKALWKTV